MTCLPLVAAFIDQDPFAPVVALADVAGDATRIGSWTGRMDSTAGFTGAAFGSSALKIWGALMMV
jgi:hypothetical protein